jgi:tRNA (guanine26-N2/guanine27-N2)-dimethyltransferase
MWSDSIHDSEFVAKVLTHVEENQGSYGTATRMKGMLTVAEQVSTPVCLNRAYVDFTVCHHEQELDLPFYFTPAKLAGMFHCSCPPLEDVA